MAVAPPLPRSEEHTSELQSRGQLVCRLLLEKKKRRIDIDPDRSQSPTFGGLSFGSVVQYDNIRVIAYGEFYFFFNDTATTEIYTLSLHDALPNSAPPLP